MGSRHCLWLLLAVALRAQALTIPAALEQKPAGSYTTWPFGVAGPLRVQALYESSECAATTPVAVRALELRTDELRVQPGKAAISVQIELGTTAATGATLSPTFAQNRGANHTVAFARRLVSLPISGYGFPGPFLPAFVLDAPFGFDPQAGNLLVEIDVAAQPAGAIYLDTPASFALGAHRAIAAGCGPYAPTTGGGLGHLLSVFLYGGPPQALAVHVLGFARLAVPVLLSPGCFLYLDPVLLTPGALDQTGFGQVAIPVPAEAALRGASVFSQYLVIAASLQLLASNDQEVVLGGTHHVHRVYSLGSNSAPSGLVQNGVAPVLRITP